MKPTRFMSSSPQMLVQLDHRCDRSHNHRHLTGGRCADAAFYPLPLIKAILKGIKATHGIEKTKREDKKSQTYLHAIGSQVAPEVESQPTGISHCYVKRYKSGAKVRIDFEKTHFKDRCIDEYTGDILKHDLIKAAMIEELTYFC